VKPANIYLLPDGRVKLGDFGVAKLRQGDATDASGEQIVGTVHYMSTEQITGQRVGPRSDVYSLGCVLFEMLTGRVPYDGVNVPQILDGHVSRPLPPVVGPEGRVPEAIERIVHRALAKQPAERYQSARELANDLEEVARTSERGGWRRWLPT
jgi:eukaryotic-like serine/threonine-protein kinase